MNHEPTRVVLHVLMYQCGYLRCGGAGLQLGVVGLDRLVQNVVCCNLLLYIRQVGAKCL